MSTYYPYRRPSKINEYGLKRIPDYTELAYKEAVSKLRYFLSGNYPPSVRSYGGSASIKNLDESDADLDKKYSTSPYALTEYRPRPRLTAKYATLYADSLNNIKYSPTHAANLSTPAAAAAPAADLTGGTNPDVINFIQKQEEYIEQLERESQYCRDELNNLLGKVKEVISENEHLHEAQKNKLISRMFHSYNGGSETDELDDFGDSTGLDSDNKATPSKTRKGKPRSTKLEGPNIVFESRIAELEAQLAQAKIDLKKIQEENNENKRKLASGLVDSTCLDGFKRQIDNLQRDKSSLEAQISKLKLSLEQKEGDFEGRYKRGSDLEHQLREERNNLESELRRLKDDLAKERSKIRELAGEGARRAIQERSAAEQRYNAHFDELQHDLAVQYDNVSKLQLDLERQRREENDLKRELSMKTAAVEELKMELKNKAASLQADLAQAHAEKASLDEELASARLAIERQQRQAKHETNRLNSEIQSLRQRLDRADADLVHSRRENLRLTEQISTLEKELNMKNLTPISPEKHKKEKELSTALESIENKHAKTVAELESMIQSQNSLMEKLTGECRLLTDKLDDANRRHKEELATLQHQIEALGRTMQPKHTSPSNYQAPTTHSPETNRNVSSPQADTRPNDSGDNSSRYTRLPDQSAERSREYAIQPQPIRTIERQESRSSLLSQKVEEPTNVQYHQPVHSNEYESNANNAPQMEQQDTVGELMEVEHVQEYEATDQNYSEGNYENYEQNQVTEVDYQNQEIDQSYEQPQYTQEQYQNYEQNQQYDNYPQQYVDPNTQYEGQYENYTTEGNYQIDQNYDNIEQQEYAPQNEEIQQVNEQYSSQNENVQNQEYVPQNQVATSEGYEPNVRPESIRSNSPKNKQPSQS